MNKTYKAILIDAHKQTVTEVVTTDYKSYYPLMQCSTFTTGFQLPKRDICFVDDEGLINGTNVFFMYEGAPQPFAGSGLIIGGTPSGKTRDAQISLAEVQSKVKFLNAGEVAAMYH